MKVVFGSFIFLLLTFSCVSQGPIEKFSLTTQKEVHEWIAEYKEAQSITRISKQKSCDLFKALQEKKAPTPKISKLVDLRALQVCSPEEYHMEGLEEWLQKDAIFFGLRHTENHPEIFQKYYEAYQNLKPLEKSEVEFLERYRLAEKGLEKAKQEKNKKAQEYLREQFPVFYVLDNLKVPEAKLFEAAYGLRMTRRFEQAKKIYNQIISDSKQKVKVSQTRQQRLQAYLKISRAYELLRTVYRVEESKERGIIETKKAVTYLGSIFFKNKTREFATPYTNHAVQLARDIWTAGRVSEAKKILQNLLTQVSKSASLDQVHWVLGRMEQESGNFDTAIQFYRQAIKINEDKAFGMKLQWLIAWSLKGQGKDEETLQELESLAEMAKKQMSDVYFYKAQYWQSQILKKQGDEKKAKNILESIAEDNFFGYYGRLAALELGDLKFFKTRSKEFRRYDAQADILENIRILKIIDEQSVISSYISSEWWGLGRSKRRSYARKKEFAFYYHFGELFKQNQQFIEIFSYQDKIDLYEDHPYFFFPYPYEKTMKHYSQSLDVPKELVYSLMRQESLFDPKARSPADAFGLLQLLPRVAKVYQKKMGIEFESPEDLYNPEVIIPLGVAHLEKLMSTYTRSMLLTAASYNAGTNPVNGWLRSKDSSDVVEFVENIPYAETETYVKLVFRNLFFYSLFDSSLSEPQRVELLRDYFVLNPPEKKTSKTGTH